MAMQWIFVLRTTAGNGNKKCEVASLRSSAARRTAAMAQQVAKDVPMMKTSLRFCDIQRRKYCVPIPFRAQKFWGK
eukprot:4910934-Amphidinium_carterae.2